MVMCACKREAGDFRQGRGGSEEQTDQREL